MRSRGCTSLRSSTRGFSSTPSPACCAGGDWWRMPRFETGLVVGKFSPLHKGHQLVLDSATAACERLVVLSYSNPEFARCEAARRERWLRALYPDAEVHVLTEGLPPNDAPELEQRLFVARFCARAPPQAVFTSEDYGPGFAAELGRQLGREVTHVSVDPARARVPISGMA